METIRFGDSVCSHDILNPKLLTPEVRWAVLFEYFSLLSNPFYDIESVRITPNQKHDGVDNFISVNDDYYKLNIFTHNKVIKSFMRKVKQMTLTPFYIVGNAYVLNHKKHYVVNQVESGNNLIIQCSTYLLDSYPDGQYTNILVLDKRKELVGEGNHSVSK